ncbi:MT-A70 family methyltransferase [Azospirillum sp. TSH58]|uniref:MT-A70 family methyltransferase n=1 Tax=Azospirillum sp. TSH58 TaxID=664962 RepID=UPI0018EEC71D|nr:MT-A70 family methyltransferase [Azospirillum sp. TSH58]
MKARPLPAPLLFDDLPTMKAAPAGAPLTEAWRPAEWEFAPLVPQRYRLIMADPAWEFTLRSPKGEGKAPQKHYRCMPLAQIKALPVRQLAHPDGCLLWLWATWAMLRLAFECIDAWGARYVTGAPWVKVTKNGKRSFGPGYVLRECTELFLLAAFGAPPYGPGCRSERGLIETMEFEDGEPLAIEALVREHSRKPDEQYEKARRLIPHGPACELFARQPWPGFEVWGNETNKFTPEVRP